MARVTQSACLAIASVVLMGLQRQPPPAALDPAQNLVRTRAFLTTTAAAVDFAVDGASLANAVFTVRNGPASVRTVIDRNTIHVTGNSQGSSLDLEIDMILADVLAGTTVGWTLSTGSSARSTLELRNVNGPQAAVDSFDLTGSTARFTSRSDLLRVNGPIGPVGGVDSHLVLAFFYPWWDLSGWSSPLFSDMPLQPYSTDNPEDLARVMTQARTAGLDGLVVSWAGKDFNGQIDHRRMLACLSAAKTAGTKIAALFETTVANPEHVDGIADPQTVFRWLVDIVDDYATRAEYLRVGSRPVVLAYAAQRMSQAGWADALARLRATGRDVLLIGEGINAMRLGALDGQFFYASNDYQGDAIREFDRIQSLSVRTYHLLPNDMGRRRIWVATVSPGYDDSQLKDGRVPRATDREGGRYYTRQWQAAVDMRADWIVVTSWNEWLENTEIEPSVRYGDLYLRMTKLWSVAFRRQRVVPRP
jgi:Glycosyl hydrolase family 99